MSFFKKSIVVFISQSLNCIFLSLSETVLSNFLKWLKLLTWSFMIVLNFQSRMKVSDLLIIIVNTQILPQHNLKSTLKKGLNLYEYKYTPPATHPTTPIPTSRSGTPWLYYSVIWRLGDKGGKGMSKRC